MVVYTREKVYFLHKNLNLVLNEVSKEDWTNS